jgi:peptidoglycan/xylan/chitin deacetylase (PgdA/CDA1 family)
MKSCAWNLRRLLAAVAHRAIGIVTHVSTQDNVVALTFDDGPHPVYTPRLLNVLGAHGAHATFFMVGEAAQRHPDLVREVARADHAIGNHSWDHQSLPLISSRERRAQIRACEKAITPYGQRLLRPPYGHQPVASLFDALCLGYQVIAWSLHAYDWLDHDANWMADRLVSRIRPGDVILLHDAIYQSIEDRYADREPMLKAVDILLERLGGAFRFITVPELLRHGRPQRQRWCREADPDWLNRLGGPGGAARYSPPAAGASDRF